MATNLGQKLLSNMPERKLLRVKTNRKTVPEKILVLNALWDIILPSRFHLFVTNHSVGKVLNYSMPEFR